jgi:carbon monoxide dehydrogenase subunit G
VRLDHSFTVPAPVDEAWRVLLDVPRVAPCLPGAALTGFDGEKFTGTVKVKLGPITLEYRGVGRIVARDEAAHRAVIEASGRDIRTAGTAGATVTATLTAEGDATRVDVATDLTVTGRPAQFGRSMLADVGARLVGQFADRLAATLGGLDGGEPPPAEGVRPVAAPGPPPGQLPEPAVEPVDLLRVTAGTAAFRRYAGYALLVAAALAVLLLVRGRRGRKK